MNLNDPLTHWVGTSDILCLIDQGSITRTTESLDKIDLDELSNHLQVSMPSQQAVPIKIVNAITYFGFR